ncbi:MAG: hypothetical protein JNK73_03725 [Bacteroidia bacterium]|nr:hypothetical protein [Bacteroidia bacterium]
MEKVTIRLHDSICEITVPKMHNDDTLFFWTDKSDHSCGFLRKYRLQSRSEPIVMESGFVKTLLPSAKFFLTIEHSSYAECDTGFAIFKEFPKLISEHLVIPHTIDSSRNISDKKLFIYKYMQPLPDTVLVTDAVFEEKKRVIHLKFENRIDSRKRFDSIVDQILLETTIH